MNKLCCCWWIDWDQTSLFTFFLIHLIHNFKAIDFVETISKYKISSSGAFVYPQVAIIKAKKKKKGLRGYESEYRIKVPWPAPYSAHLVLDSAPIFSFVQMGSTELGTRCAALGTVTVVTNHFSNVHVI